jgi:group I intron endonuclease
MQGVYAIEHRESGKRYIGSSIRVERRFSEWTCALNKNVGGCGPLQAAWNEFGSAAFKMFLVEEVGDREQLKAREREWIRQTVDRYNVSLDPEAFFKGLHHKVESKDLTRAAITGIKRSAVTKAKISHLHKGKPKSPEHRAKLSDSLKGRVPPHALGPKSAEHRAKIGAAHRGRTNGSFSPERKAKVSEGLRAAWARRKQKESDNGIVE